MTNQTEDEYLHYINFLSHTIEDLTNFPSDRDMYAYIAASVAEITPHGSIILVNSLDTNNKRVTLRACEGLDSDIDQIEKILGRPLMGITFLVSDPAMLLFCTDECEEIFGGVKTLTFGALPDEVCNTIGAMPFFGRVFGIGICWKGSLHGSVIIILPPGCDLNSSRVISIFVRQVAGSLERVKAEEAARRERDRLNLITETSPVGIVYVDNQGMITFANRHAEEILGISKDMITYRTYHAPEWKITTEDGNFFPESELPFEMIRVSGKPARNVVHAIEWPDGRRRILSINAAPIHDEEGNFEGMVATVDDITERRRIDKALEEELGLFVRGPTILFTWSHDQGWPILYVSPNIKDIFGYLPEYLRAEKVRYAGLIHPDDLTRVKQEVEEHCQNGTEYFGQEYRIAHADGSYRWIYDFKVIERNKKGEVTHYNGYVLDITNRKRVEEALASSEASIKALMNATSESALLTDVHGIILAANTVVAERLRHTPDEIIGREAYSFIPPELAASRRLWTEKAIKTGEPVIFEDVRFGRIIENNVYPVKDEKGEVFRCAIFGRDVTEEKNILTALKESEKRYRDLFENNKAVMLLIDPESTRIIDANRAASDYYGYSLQELTHLSISDINIADHNLIQKKITQAEEQNGTFFQFLHRKKSGEIRDVEVFNAPVLIDGKRHLHSIIQDVTDRKRIEKALLESENKYRELIQNASSIIVKFDKDANVLFFNEYAQEFFGYTEDEILGKNIIGTIVEKVDSSGRDLEQMIQDLIGHPDQFTHNENENITKDGRRVWVSWRNKPIYQDGTFTGLFSVGTDITQRKKAEEALLEREQFLANVFTSIQDGISILDNNLRIVRVNATMEQWYAHQGSLPGRFCYEVYHGSATRCNPCPSHRTLTTGLTASEILPKRGPDNSITGWLEVYSYPLVEMKSGEMAGVIEYVRDISDRRIAEDALKQANLKLNLLSSITRHDVLNLITALRGYQDFSEDLIQSGKLREYFNKQIQVTEAIQSQIEFTKDYQDLGIRSPIWQDVARCIYQVQRKLILEGITVLVEIPDIIVLADPLFEKVFYTLMENSQRHGERVTSIRWSLLRTAESFRIIYEDDGNGVLDVDKERIFVRGIGKHTGLGLFLAREILAITRMEIKENGQYGKGVRFEILVPPGAYRNSVE
ncbi:MAG TPA: PAS domain S-box protein [Methanospirillum sp.]|nr:PAS domain S-box protein [Methanospirillum sp.]